MLGQASPLKIHEIPFDFCTVQPSQDEVKKGKTWILRKTIFLNERGETYV